MCTTANRGSRHVRPIVDEAIVSLQTRNCIQVVERRGADVQ